MTPISFDEQTTVLGAPPDWDAATHGPCEGLPCAYDADQHQWRSVWRPSWRELLSLLFGGRVNLWLIGDSHPPVRIEVRR